MAMAEKPGNIAAPFLMLGPGARPAAMGNAWTALPADVNALYWNPAGLARTEQSELMFMYSSWVQDIDYNYLAYVHGERIYDGVIGGNLTYLDYGTIDITRINNQAPVTGLGQTDASDLALGIGYGHRWYAVDWGVNVKYIRENIAGSKDGVAALDLGILFNNLPPNFEAGLVLMNIGGKLQLQREAFALPFTGKAGVAYQLPQFPLILSADWVVPKDNTSYMCAGAEVTLQEMLSLRVGYNGENDADNGLTAGVGFKLRNEFAIDYAYVPYGDLGDAHRLSLAYRFGGINESDPDPVPPQQNRPTALAVPESPPPVAPEPPRTEYRSAESYIDAAQEYYRRGNHQAAIENYYQALSIEPANTLALYNLAVTFYTMQDYARAADNYYRYSQYQPRDANGFLYLGVCYQQLGKTADAISCWDRVLALDPNNHTARQLRERVAGYR